MLVLSRKSNEQVLFPELGISIEVIRVKGNQVRLGITAPDSIRILRGELKRIVDQFEQPALNSKTPHVHTMDNAVA